MLVHTNGKENMTDNAIHERYRELACAVIRNEYIRFINTDTYTDYAYYKWLYDCTYFDLLEIDREYFYVKSLRKKESKTKEKVKRGREYGRKI